MGRCKKPHIILRAGAGGIAIAAPLMLVFSGQEYLPAVPVACAMSPIIIAVSFSSFLCNVILTPHRKEQYILYSQTVGCILNVVLNALFIPRWGVLGAGISTLIVEFSIMLVQFAFSIRLLGGNLLYIGIQFAEGLAGTAVMLAAAILFLRQIPLPASLHLAGGMAVGMAAYAAAELLLRNETALLLLGTACRRLQNKRAPAKNGTAPAHCDDGK